MSRRSTILPKSAERRSTPTTVRASGFERSGDNSTACAKARPRVSVQAEGKDEGDPTLARPVRQSALSRSDPRRCREGCNPHPAVPSPAPARKVIRQGALSAQRGGSVSPLGRNRARSFFPDLGRRLVLVGGRRNRNNAARVVFRARRALIFPPIEGRTLAPRWMASGAGFLNLSWSSRVCRVSNGGDHGQRTCEGRRGQG